MKVGIDISPLVQTRAGTARHVTGLLGELSGRPGLELVGLEAGGTGRLATVRRDALWYPFRLGHASAHLDVLHCTTFRAPVAPRAPLVVTVHDTALLRHPEAFPRWHRVTGALALRGGVRAADAVVAVSAFTRDELVALLGVPVERIRIVPNGVDPVFSPNGPAGEGDYVLAVGTLEPRKNLAAAVEAARLAGVELRVAGAAGWGDVATAGWVGEPTDAALAELMRGARCLVYPSLYEGFGLPVLEAMACGTPVVTSRGGATEEVAGGAAVLVDPGSPASIAAGIDEAARRRAELREIGLHRAAMFTWRRSADNVEALWRELA
ncbi:MAG TPA: glycosyltransferase family 1 protein [Gaiella sp.]|uniref:glycosyltransferase family 4 protein n=1 Tax=Gaiella sp. TaxID=2663207 RepID=UPI002D7E8D08|nr:glycosyltransferase family 1 protein [Gaiella sp.]HET9287442.1 glycosyltransferase family 1 protein [Gaiella sp.]